MAWGEKLCRERQKTHLVVIGVRAAAAGDAADPICEQTASHIVHTARVSQTGRSGML